MSAIYFATNRNPIFENGEIVDFGPDFGEGRGQQLRFGVAEVEDGKLVSLTVLPDSPAEGSAEAFGRIKTKMKAQGRDTLIVLHGYATGFREAILGAWKTKQAFSDRNLNVLLYTWPSDGKNTPQAYGDDRNDAAASGIGFARGLWKAIDFLREDGTDCGQRIHLLAHSMGNYVLRHALQAALKLAPRGHLPTLLDNVFLMHADEDADAFEHDHKLKRLNELTRAVHVYVSRHDRALLGGALTKTKTARLGQAGPSKPFDLPAGVTVVDMSRLDRFVTDFIGHSLYDERPQAIRDVLQVLGGLEPHEVQGRAWDPGTHRYIILP